MLGSVNPRSALPIYRQIIEQIRRAVASGQLAPGDQLPSVRDLAAQLLVNPNTVARVYRDLERDGLLETRRGQGTYVSAEAATMADSERRQLVAEQLEKAAQDARAFGLDAEEAVELFRSILAEAERSSNERK